MARFRLLHLLSLWRFVAPLLLLMISVHALTPLGPSLQRASGSAFSAETVEVSLRSSQRGAVVKQDETAKPPVPLVPPPLRPSRVSSAGEATLAVPGLGPTGPPPVARTSFSPLAPRAPPAA